MTSERQASPKQSKERCAGFWESAQGEGMSDGIPKDGNEVRSLIKSVRRSDRKFVFEL